MDVSVIDLWFPILLSAVFVFIVSSILHMVIPIHKSDCKQLPGEAKLLEAMRSENIEPGSYSFPWGTMKEMGTPEMIEKFKQGPVGFVTVSPSGPPNMGKSLGMWFVYTIIVGIFVAYIAGLGLARGEESMVVFRMTCTAAVLGYAMGAMVDSIWKGQKWSITFKFIFDGVLYGLTTAATFTWLWPEVSLPVS